MISRPDIFSIDFLCISSMGKVFGKNHGKCAYILEKIMGDRDPPPLIHSSSKREMVVVGNFIDDHMIL